MSRQLGWMSRGTARSISSSGRPPRAAITSLRPSCSITWCGELVDVTTMSASVELLGQLLESHRAAAEAVGEADRAVVVAVGDEDRAHALGRDRTRRQLGGLAGTDDENATVLEFAEGALRELDRDGRNRHRALRDRGLAAGALAGGEGGCGKDD